MKNIEKDITKDDRIELLTQCTELLTKMISCYQFGFPGHLLCYSALANVRSLHHLESETNFDNLTLGTKGAYTDKIDDE